MAKKTRKQTKREAERVLKTGSIRRRTARDLPLPGMEDARIEALDDICVNIADARAEINALKAQEHGFQDAALGLLQEHKKRTWTHAGITLVRKPGEETLIVKNASARTRRASAEASVATADEAQPPEGIAAMDAAEDMPF